MKGIFESVLIQLSKEKRSARYVFSSTRGGQIRERRMLDICKVKVAKDNIEDEVYLHKS